MRIAIPVDSNQEETTICVSFGRAPFYAIYETDTGAYAFVENTAAHSPGGAGVKAAQLLVDQKSDILITPRCGENAVEVIHGAGIQIYQTKSNHLKDNVKAYVNGELNALDHFHKGLHHA